MYLGMNPDILQPERCASTIKRNFEGRQGAAGARTWSAPRWPLRRRWPDHFVDVRELALEPVA